MTTSVLVQIRNAGSLLPEIDMRRHLLCRARETTTRNEALFDDSTNETTQIVKIY